MQRKHQLALIIVLLAALAGSLWPRASAETAAVAAKPTHWSFIPPVRSTLPDVKDENWCRTPIDRFVLAKLEAEGLKPSPETDKVTLLRRLYLDLIGLPPKPEEVDAFVNDASPDTY